MFALWPGDQLNFSIFIKPTFVFAGQRAASEAGHIANTNVTNNLQTRVTRTIWNQRKVSPPRTVPTPTTTKYRATARIFFVGEKRYLEKMKTRIFSVYADKFSTVDKISLRRQ
jgi:hypothetical protein